MIQYIMIPNQKKTVAVIKGCAFDAISKIEKIIGDTTIAIDLRRYLMNDFYRSVVVCSEDDEYDEVVGRREAKKKLLDHYYKELDRRIKRFKDDFEKINVRIDRI